MSTSSVRSVRSSGSARVRKIEEQHVGVTLETTPVLRLECILECQLVKREVALEFFDLLRGGGFDVYPYMFGLAVPVLIETVLESFDADAGLRGQVRMFRGLVGCVLGHRPLVNSRRPCRASRPSGVSCDLKSACIPQPCDKLYGRAQRPRPTTVIAVRSRHPIERSVVVA